MSSARAFFNAIAAAKAKQPTGWSWRADDATVFYLYHDGVKAALLSIIPDVIDQRAALLDVMVAHLNKENTQ